MFDCLLLLAELLFAISRIWTTYFVIKQIQAGKFGRPGKMSFLVITCTYLLNLSFYSENCQDVAEGT